MSVFCLSLLTSHLSIFFFILPLFFTTSLSSTYHHSFFLLTTKLLSSNAYFVLKNFSAKDVSLCCIACGALCGYPAQARLSSYPLTGFPFHLSMQTFFSFFLAKGFTMGLSRFSQRQFGYFMRSLFYSHSCNFFALNMNNSSSRR